MVEKYYYLCSLPRYTYIHTKNKETLPFISSGDYNTIALALAPGLGGV
jgi:hypothetical protein